MSLEDVKNYLNRPMTKKEQFEFWQNQAESLEENILDEEEKQMVKEWKNIKVDNLKDETVEDFTKRKQDKLKLKTEEFVAVKQTKPITINTNINVIDKIKTIANNNGLNYQTLINMILYQVANGKIDIRLVI